LGKYLKGGRMTTHSNFAHLNLEYYRKQAKKLLKAAGAGDADALARLAAVSRSSVRTDDYKLHDAQLAIAREEGFASWPKFQAVLKESKLKYREMAKAFVGAATSDLRRATEMLVEHPELVRVGIWVALVLGVVARVKGVLDDDGEFAKRKGGPDKLEPLMYVCFSRFANRASGRSDGLIETARLLLKHGADASGSFTPPDLPDNPLSCLYAATGVNNNPALALVLLEAGANPNDNESLYHSTEHADHECTKLLLEIRGEGREFERVKSHARSRRSGRNAVVAGGGRESGRSKSPRRELAALGGLSAAECAHSRDAARTRRAARCSAQRWAYCVCVGDAERSEGSSGSAAGTWSEHGIG
jgi:hypothetical protein